MAPRPLLSPRQQTIIELAESDGAVEVEALAAHFSVTPQTIRRDLNELCAHGLLMRHHGGARAVNSVANTGYEQRRVDRVAEKQRIGRAAAALIPNACSLVLNIGTTTEQVARALAVGHHDLVVITNNIHVVSILGGAATRELYIAGGAVRADGGVTGEATVAFFRQFRVDMAVIGASAVEEDGTVLDFDYHEVTVARAILESARRRMLVVDSSKFQRRAAVRIAALGQFDVLVTDAWPGDRLAACCERDGVQLVIAEETPDPANG